MGDDILRDILELEAGIRLKVETERYRCAEQIKATRQALEAERMAAVERLQQDRTEAFKRTVDETRLQSEEQLQYARKQAERLRQLTEEQVESLLLASLSRLIPE